jgi:peptidoglycan/xylan/chitin deacetylase (PgdA/CDA1 family)
VRSRSVEIGLGLALAAFVLGATAPSLPAQPAARTVELPILLYHRVDRLTARLPAITRRLTVTPAVFDAQMELLERNGFHAVTPQQLFAALERGRRLPPRPVMVTFDDGYRDVLGKASPELARLHMPATEYVITGRVSGPDSSFLTWPQLRLLERRGIEIGSHTVHHVALTSVSDSVALHELRDSRSALERHLGHRVRWLAYPYGAVNAHVVSLARRTGYLLAMTTRAGRTQSSARPLELERLEVLDTTTLLELAAMLGRRVG